MNSQIVFRRSGFFVLAWIIFSVFERIFSKDEESIKVELFRDKNKTFISAEEVVKSSEGLQQRCQT
jgi:hypothetical protein